MPDVALNHNTQGLPIQFLKIDFRINGVVHGDQMFSFLIPYVLTKPAHPFDFGDDIGTIVGIACRIDDDLALVRELWFHAIALYLNSIVFTLATLVVLEDATGI